MALRTVRAWLGALLLAGGVVLAGPVAPSSAHAELISSSPADGATLRALPASATLTFTDEIDAQFVRAAVTSPSGTSTVRATTKGTVVTVPLPSAGSGAYRVVYRVVSADGHPISGQLRFTVAGTPSATATSTPPAATAPGPAPSVETPVAASSARGADAAPAASSDPPGNGNGLAWVIGAIAVAIAAATTAVVAAVRGWRR